MRKRVAFVRLVLALALATALVLSLGAAERRPGAGHDFLAYFATQSSIVAVAAWALSAGFLLARGPAPAWVHVLRGAAVSYELVLATTRLLIALPWQASGGYPVAGVNVFVMLAAPLLLLADWLLVGDRRPLTSSFLRWVAAFPVLWSATTLLRGIETGWTPYPLLNPAVSGWRMPVYLGGTGLVALGAGVIVTWLSRHRALLPMDPVVAAVDTAPVSVIETVLQDPPTPVDSPPVSPAAEEPAATYTPFVFVEPPAVEEPDTAGASQEGEPPQA